MESIVKSDEYSSPFPVIFVLGTLDVISQIYIFADFQVLFTVDGGIVDAVVSLFASYYVFMFEYPRILKIYLFTCRNVCLTFPILKGYLPLL